MTMQIDIREKAIHKYWPSSDIVTLEIGDIIDEGFCIERKAPNDFLNSILNHHIFNQALNMHEVYPGNCVIIVEADLKSLSQVIFFGKIPNITIAGVRKAIASLYTKYHVPVLLASTRRSFVEMTNDILEKHKESNTDTKIFIESPMSKIGANPKLQVLLQVPKIGIKKATKIINHYGNFENLTKMERPNGVSEKDINMILEVLK